MEEVTKQSFNKDPNNMPVSWTTAVKFLMARKFDIRRAIDLYNSHEVCIFFTLHYLFMRGVLWCIYMFELTLVMLVMMLLNITLPALAPERQMFAILSASIEAVYKKDVCYRDAVNIFCQIKDVKKM